MGGGPSVSFGDIVVGYKHIQNLTKVFHIGCGFSRMVCPSPWLVDQATLLSRHLVKQGFDTWHKVIIMWKAS